MSFISRRAKIKVRLPVKFPANVTSESPLNITQTGANYHFTLDANALNDIVTPQYVPNRAFLKAIDVDNKKAAVIYAEGGRNGLFVFDPSDLSAKVAADTQEGIYVAPATAPSGASGAWRRVYDGIAYYKWWDPPLDGVTDNLSVAQAAYNALNDGDTLSVSGDGSITLSGNVALSGSKRLNYQFREPLDYAAADTATKFRGGEAAQSLTNLWRNTVARTLTSGLSGGVLLYDVVGNATNATNGYARDSIRINFVQYDPSQGLLTNGIEPTITKFMTGLAVYGQIGAGNYFGNAHAMLSWVLSPQNGGGSITAHEFNTFNRSDMRRTVANVARTSNVVTIETTTPHHLGIGQYVRIAVDTETSLNGWFLVTAIVNETIFTYTLAGSNIASTPETGTIEQRAINVNGGANKTAIRIVLKDDYPISAAINIDNASGLAGAFKGIYMSADTLNSEYEGEDSFKRYIQIGPGILELDKVGKLMLGKTGSSTFSNGFEATPGGIVYTTAAAGVSEFAIVRSEVLGGSEASLGKVSGRGRNSAGASTLFCGFEFRAANGTAGNAAGKMVFNNQVANTYAAVGYIGAGLVIGNAVTGGDPGVGSVNIATEYRVAGNKVVGARDTGWTAMTGTPDESTAYDTASVTLPQLAGRIMALQAALTTHGLIGA